MQNKAEITSSDTKSSALLPADKAQLLTVIEQQDSVISQQESQKLQNDNKLMDIEKIDLVDVNLSGSLAEVTVEFTSHMIMALRDEDEKIIEGNDEKPIRISDIWTFCRDVKSSDPNWTLVATRTA